jgi:hypothetical protein
MVNIRANVFNFIFNFTHDEPCITQVYQKKGNRCINIIVEVMDGENKKDLLHYFF